MTAKDLKNALLQEAVQGKLVPQIASEGNARDLLEEIRKERLSHGLDFANAKSGKRKSKKETALAGSNPCDIKEEEIPFEIPESWCWCRLGEICVSFSTGPFGTMLHKADYVEKGGVPLVNPANIKNGYIDPSNIKLVSREKYSALQAYVLAENDVIIARRGDLRKCAVVSAKEKGWLAGTGAFFLHTTGIDTSFFKLFYTSSFAQNFLLSDSIGTTMDNLNQSLLSRLPFPLPPLAEQKRIVAAIEKFMPLIEEYGKKETELKAFNEQIGALTKKAILQEAVQGKLVPQIASEGNAKDLLEEIRKERLSHGFANSYGICDGKNKKTKKSDLRSKSQISVTKKELPEITEDEILFDIPENWCWCRLGEICNEIKRGKSPKYTDKSNFLAFAQKCNVKTGGIDLSLALYLDENSIGRYSEADNLIQDDIVINSTGGGTMGRVGLYETQVPAGIKGVYPDSHVTVIRSIGNINQHYLYYVLKLNQPVLEKCGTGSTNQTELKPAVLADFVIPLPPLAEQKRIVAAIEKLLPLCEKLGE